MKKLGSRRAHRQTRVRGLATLRGIGVLGPCQEQNDITVHCWLWRVTGFLTRLQYWFFLDRVADQDPARFSLFNYSRDLEHQVHAYMLIFAPPSCVSPASTFSLWAKNSVAKFAYVEIPLSPNS